MRKNRMMVAMMGMTVLLGLWVSVQAGTVDPRLLGESGSDGKVRVLVWLEDQPTEKIARQVREVFDPRREAIGRQVRAITSLDEITPGQREEARSLLRQLDAEHTRMIKSITTAVRSLIDQDQEDLKKRVENLGGRVHRKLTIINALSATVPVEKLQEIAALSGVTYIQRVGRSKPRLDVSAYAIGADTWWDSTGGDPGGLLDFGIVDSGIDTTHDAFQGHTFYLQPRPEQGPGGGGSCAPHGNHVAGIAVSTDNTYKGVAYGAEAVISAYGGGVQDSIMYNGFDWIVTDSPDDAEVINHSMGDDDDTTTDYPARAKFLDSVVDWFEILVTQSAGNSGSGEETLDEEARAYNVITVGAMDDKGTVSRSGDEIWDSSSRGPTPDGRRKPDLTAPGVEIKSSVPTDDFTDMSGTSMAAPHVAGGVILLSNYGYVSAEQIKAILINTADDSINANDPSGWDKNYGWGYVNLDSAWAHRGHCLLGLVNYTTQSKDYQGTMGPGEKATLVWHRKVTYNPNDPGSPTDYGLKNVDLYLWNSDKSTILDSCTTDSNNVEQVRLPTSESTQTVKIEVRGVGFSPGDAVTFGLATPSTFQLSEKPVAEARTVPKAFSLGQNYPNPFNPMTVVRFELPHATKVNLVIYNTLGQAVRTLVNEHRARGAYQVQWDGKDVDGLDVASGIYFVRMKAGDFVGVRKMVVLR